MKTSVSQEGVTLTDLIHLSPWEADWCGNFAFRFFSDRIVPIEPMFLHFRTKDDVVNARLAGVTRDTLRHHFMGVCMAAIMTSWNSDVAW